MPPRRTASEPSASGFSSTRPDGGSARPSTPDFHRVLPVCGHHEKLRMWLSGGHTCPDACSTFRRTGTETWTSVPRTTSRRQGADERHVPLAFGEAPCLSRSAPLAATVHPIA
jgi:hypothetical protein